MSIETRRRGSRRTTKAVHSDPERARVVGLAYQALPAGVMVQLLTDPETAPSAEDLTDGLRAILHK